MTRRSRPQLATAGVLLALSLCGAAAYAASMFQHRHDVAAVAVDGKPHEIVVAPGEHVLWTWTDETRPTCRAVETDTAAAVPLEPVEGWYRRDRIAAGDQVATWSLSTDDGRVTLTCDRASTGPPGQVAVGGLPTVGRAFGGFDDSITGLVLAALIVSTTTGAVLLRLGLGCRYRRSISHDGDSVVAPAP